MNEYSVLCTGNSCRSILAEATFNHLAPVYWRALSAGSQPTGEVHPRSLALLAAEGIDASDCASKSWDALPVTPDIVITVCASAAGETCPAYLGPVLRSHWGWTTRPRPPAARPTSTPPLCAYRVLRARIEALLALPAEQLHGERAALKAELDRIGQLSA